MDEGIFQVLYINPFNFHNNLMRCSGITFHYTDAEIDTLRDKCFVKITELINDQTKLVLR